MYYNRGDGFVERLTTDVYVLIDSNQRTCMHGGAAVGVRMGLANERTGMQRRASGAKAEVHASDVRLQLR